MGLFDNIMKQSKNVVHSAANAVSGAVNNAVGGRNHTESFTFSVLPCQVEQLMSLPEAALDSPYKTTALVMAALLRFEADPEGCFAMLDALCGPEPMTPYAKNFIKERMAGKGYLAKSFFRGATVENSYEPTVPYTICVSENPYSFTDENWATMYVKSSGADNPRPIKLRRKPSTNQWFLNDIQCLSDIRVPASADPWA